MTQNRLTLGITSFLITTLALIYIFTPHLFDTPYAYAQGTIQIDKNEEGLISGIIKTADSHVLADVPITVTGYDNSGKLVNIASGLSDIQGKFSIAIQKSSILNFR